MAGTILTAVPVVASDTAVTCTNMRLRELEAVFIVDGLLVVIIDPIALGNVCTPSYEAYPAEKRRADREHGRHDPRQAAWRARLQTRARASSSLVRIQTDPGATPLRADRAESAGGGSGASPGKLWNKRKGKRQCLGHLD